MSAAQSSRDELLALGRKKLQAFQQSRGKAPASPPAPTPSPPLPHPTSSLPPSNGAPFPQPAPPAPSLPFPSLSSLPPPTGSLPPDLPSITPRRDLFPFLDAAANAEPSTPPSSSFLSSASFTAPQPPSHFSSHFPSHSPSLTASYPPSQPPDPAPDRAPQTSSLLSSAASPTPNDLPNGHADVDSSSIQYYQDDQGFIFYYDDSLQPVYLPATYQPPAQPPAPDAPEATAALQQKLADYEAYIAQLQASLVSSPTSPLPALQTLTHELSLAQSQADTLRSQLRAMQGEVAAKGQQVTELMEDNVRLMEEYEAVCEELRQAEEALIPAPQPLPHPTPHAGQDHSDLLLALQGDALEMERVGHQSRRVMDALRVQWRQFLTQIQTHAIPSYRPSPALLPAPAPQTPSLGASFPSNFLSPYTLTEWKGKPADSDDPLPRDSDASLPQTSAPAGLGATAGQMDWARVLEQVDRVSTLLAGKEDIDQLMAMHSSHIRQLLDPVALLLSPDSTAGPLSSSDRLLSASPQAEPSVSTSAVLLADLQSARQAQQELHEQLQHQQERASSLIRDKLMLAKRIEAAYEEKATLEQMLREALLEVGQEKEEYRRRLEGGGRQETSQNGVVPHSNFHAAPAFTLPPAREPSRGAPERKRAKERRVKAQRRGLIGSLLSLLFGGGDGGDVDTEDVEEAEGRVVMV